MLINEVLNKAKSLFKKDDEGQVYNEDLASEVNKEFEKRQNEKKPFELQWRLNGEFISGNQNLDINPFSNTIEENPANYWFEERENFNQCATIVETRVARLIRQKPMMKVRPASGEEKDISASKVTSQLLQSSWHDQDMNPKYNDKVSWLEYTGTVFEKPVWNWNKGRIVYKGPDPNSEMMEGQELVDQDDPFQRNLNEVEIREGDIETIIVPSYEIYPDSSFHDGVDKCRSIIHARAYHVKEIFDTWGVKVDPEKVDATTMQSSKTSGGLGYNATGYRASTTSLKEYAIVKEYYERPSKDYPKGRFIIVAGEKTLYAGILPYQIGRDGDLDLPFIRTVSIHVPGCFWGKAVIERCIPIQRRYNLLRNKIQEYINLVAVGQWYEPEGSLADDVELTNEPGLIIPYNPGVAKPEPVQHATLPADFHREEATLLSEFTAVSGVSELSRFSEAPSGVKSGVALAQASEQDDTRIATTASRIANSTAKLGQYWIRLYRQFVQEPRILRTVGSNKEVDVKEWTTSDLTSDDVIIENSSSLAETPAQRRQMVFDLIGTGIFNRPETNPFTTEGVQKILELIEYGHWEAGLDDDSRLQRTRAKRENKRLTEGQPAMVMDFDDHNIHIQQHNRFRMSPEYEELLKTEFGPMIDEMMRMHLAEHMQILVANMPQIQQDQEQQNQPKQ